MPFEAYKIYEEYEPDKFKTSTQKKVEQALDTAKKEGLVPKSKEINIELMGKCREFAAKASEFFNNFKLKFTKLSYIS